MIPSPPPAYVAQAEMPALSADLQLAFKKRIGAIRGGVVIVVRARADRARFDVFPTEGAPKVDENTRFEIGEVSEAITGTLLADAARRGELRIDEPIDQITMTSSTDVHAPARGGAAITLRMLATHRSGLPRIPLREAVQPYASFDRAALVAAVNGAKLEAAPGARYAPSNVDDALLGMLLADRAGTPFATLARDRIFTPASMVNTVADSSADDRLVREYAISGGAVAPWRWNAFAPDGGVRSTAVDLVRFVSGLYADENGPLAQDLRLAATPTADAGPDAGIGLGWLVDRRSGVVYASGASYGTVAFVGAAPQRKEAVVILANVGLGFANGSLDDLGLRLLAERFASTVGSTTGR